MPELLTTNNIGFQGIATDPQPWSLPPEFITAGKNFRIFAGSILSAGGSVLWNDHNVDFFPGHLLNVAGTVIDAWLIPGRTAVYAFDGANWFDISSVAGYPNINVDDELLWTSCIIGQIPVICNPLAFPEYWFPVNVGQIMQPLPFDASNTWADLDYTANIFRSHKNFLFALNLIEGGTDFPDVYRWSHPADINGLPPTWDENDDAFLAGRSALGGDRGRIIDGRSLRDAFAIYSSNGIDILDFTNDEFVWRRRELSTSSGLLATEALVEVKGVHYFLANGDILRNDGNSIESIAHNRIRRDIAQRIDADNFGRSYAVRSEARKEIWFCIPEIGEEYPNVAYIYNWRDDSWAIRDLPAGIAYADYGSQSTPIEAWDGFPDTEEWDSQERVWGSTTLTPLDDTIIGVNPVQASVTILDSPATPDDDINSFIERTDYPLLGHPQVTTITRVYPHIKGEGTLVIQIGAQDTPGAPVRWEPEVVYNALTDRKIDVRATGELHAWRYRSIGKITWELSGFTFEYSKSGLR